MQQAEAELLDDLNARRAAWHKRQLKVAERDAALGALESELETRMNSIAELERRLQTQLGIGKLAQERRDERVASLADLIATMPPQSGAEIVAQMSDRDAQWLILAIARKSDRKAAKLLASMPADRAAALGQLYLDTDPDSIVQKGELREGSTPVLPEPKPPPPPAVEPAATPSAASTPGASHEAAPDASPPTPEAKP
ncbi:MAG: hypothetical protein B7733_09525 [Myxococcales bacterium FL481]|nr:MAG: hypothetical protein B7733_09525 [Myxococcales bacterium FL481]